MGWRDLVLSDDYDIDSLVNRDEAVIERIAPIAEWVRRYHKASVSGLEHVPDGPALYVANHNAGFWTPDTWIFTKAVYDRFGIDAVPYGLGHEFAIRLRGAHSLLVKLGAVRASHDNAQRLFEAGKKVLVYPGGDEDAWRPFSRRHEIVFGGRRGYIRLALRAGVPIVPVVSCGAHSTWVVMSDNKWLARLIGVDRSLRIKVWPTILSMPWGVTVGPPPPYLPFPSRILIEALEPIRFDRTGPEAAADDSWVAHCARRVESRMQTCLDRLSVERRRLRQA